MIKIGAKFLDNTGLAYFWSKIKAYVEDEITNVEFAFSDVVIERRSITYTNGWATNISKTGYVLLNAYAIRDDADYTVQINRRTSGAYTLFASGAANTTQTIEFIWIRQRSAASPSPAIDLLYPIGSYYETSDTSFDPNTAWGGTWEDVTRNVITSSGTKTVNTSTTVGLVTITLQPNTRYLLLGNTQSNVSGYTSYIITFSTTGASEVLLGASRTYVNANGGLTGFQYCVTGNSTASVTLQCYGYYGSSHTETGQVVAIPLDGCCKGSRWHRVA